MPRAFRSNFIPTHYIVLLRGLDTQKLPTCLKNVTHKMSFSRHVQMNKLSFNFDALLHLLPLRVLTRIFFFYNRNIFLARDFILCHSHYDWFRRIKHDWKSIESEWLSGKVKEEEVDLLAWINQSVERKILWRLRLIENLLSTSTLSNRSQNGKLEIWLGQILTEFAAFIETRAWGHLWESIKCNLKWNWKSLKHHRHADGQKQNR